MKKSIYVALFSFGLPMSAFAAPTVDSVIGQFIRWVDAGTSIAAALALLVFFLGLVKFIIHAGDEKAKEEGRRIMVWGTVALFVLFSIFGLIRFLQNSFDLRNNQNMKPPRVIFGP